MGNKVSIEIEAWWLLTVPFLLMSALVIIAIIMKHTDNENNSKNTLTSWVTLKDVLYWLLFICLGTISIFTFQYKGNGDVISHWGFAGTIVSIILAVVAIGFTLFQTLSSNLSSEKITVSAEKIEMATNNLDLDIIQQSKEIMVEAADYLKEKMVFFEGKLNSINEGQKAIHEIAATKFGPSKKELQTEGLTKDVIDLDTFFNQIFNNLPYFPRFFIYALLRMVNNGIELKPEISKTLIEEYTREVELRYANMASLGATESFVVNLGIIRKFDDLSGEDQEVCLLRCKENLESSDIEFIGNIIDKIIPAT